MKGLREWWNGFKTFFKKKRCGRCNNRAYARIHKENLCYHHWTEQILNQASEEIRKWRKLAKESASSAHHVERISPEYEQHLLIPEVIFESGNVDHAGTASKPTK